MTGEICLYGLRFKLFYLYRIAKPNSTINHKMTTWLVGDWYMLVCHNS